MSTQPPILLGLLGLGHLGKIHAKCLHQLSDAFSVRGIFDLDEAAAQQVGVTYGWEVFPSPESLFEALRHQAGLEPYAVDIVTPTPSHFVLAKAALLAGCHVFIEKPITVTVEEAIEIEELGLAQGKTVQVGHVERFNPALRSLEMEGLKPVFIEAHRLAQFNPRAMDVSVVLDLMIHDLDIVLSLVDSPIERVSASGVGVVGDTIDIANARLDFADGTTANLTASRISLKNMRKLRLFQRDAYIGVDLLEKQTEIVRLSNHDPEAPGLFQLPTPAGLREVVMQQPEIQPSNAIIDELRDFFRAIHTSTAPLVSGRDGRRALELAHRILAEIESRGQLRPSHNVKHT